MQFREMIQSDVVFVAKHSISRSIFSKEPAVTDYSYCLEDNETILGVGGIRLINLTTAWAWLDITKFAEKHVIVFYRVIKDWMEFLCRQHKIRRLQIYVETDFPKAVKMAEHLGFHREHIMPKFIDDKPAYLYVQFFDLREK